jgi:hypothetical protein
MLNTDLRFSIGFFRGNSPKDMTITDLLGYPAGASYNTLLGTLPGGETKSNIVGVARASGPAGVFYNAGYGTLDFSAPIINGSTNDWLQASIALPLSGSEILCGTYSFDYAIRVNVLSSLIGYNVAGYFEISGNYVSLIGAAPTEVRIQIYGGTHSGTYTITSATYDAGTGYTRVVVSGPPSSFTADLGEACGIVFYVSKSYAYCYTPATLDIDAESSCIFSTLTATDDTTYPVAFNGTTITPTITRAWSITGPSSYCATAVTGSGNPFVIGYGTVVHGGANIWTGDYLVQLTSTLVYDVETWGVYNWFIVNDSIVSTTTHNVACESCFCDLKQCVENLFTKYREALGNNKAEADRLSSKVMKVLEYWMLYMMAERCGTTYSEYCAAIQAIVLGEDCQCDTSDTSVSTEVVPLALMVSPSSTGCKITFGAAGDGFPTGPVTGDMHIFNTTAGSYTMFDVYWYNGSSWVLQGNIKGATGAAGAAGADGADGSDGTSIVYSSLSTNSTTNVAYTTLKTSGSLTNLNANGDTYEFQTLCSTSAIIKVSDYIKIQIDSLDLNFNVVPYCPATVVEHWFCGNCKTITINGTLTVTDYAAKTAYLVLEVDYLDSNGDLIKKSDIMCYTVTTSALNNIAISVLGHIGATGSVTCLSLIVKFLNKI